MVDSRGLIARISDSPVAIVGAVLIVTLLAVLVSRIGLPPRRALLSTGIAAFVLLMVIYDWYYRR